MGSSELEASPLATISLSTWRSFSSSESSSTGSTPLQRSAAMKAFLSRNIGRSKRPSGSMRRRAKGRPFQPLNANFLSSL